MKLKRNFVNQRYAVDIDAMYGERVLGVSDNANLMINAKDRMALPFA